MTLFQLCERVYVDLIGRLEPRVIPRHGLLDPGESDNAPRWREPARHIEAFLESRGARLPASLGRGCELCSLCFVMGQLGI